MPEVLHKTVDVVRLREGDLEAHGPRDVAGQAGEALLSRPANADQEGRTSRHLDEAVESQQMPQGVVEQYQLQLPNKIERVGVLGDVAKSYELRRWQVAGGSHGSENGRWADRIRQKGPLDSHTADCFQPALPSRFGTIACFPELPYKPV